MLDFDRSIYTKDIFSAADNPYMSWLEAAAEKQLLETWLKTHLHLMKVSDIRNRPVQVIDYGCSWGSTSFRLLRVLHNMGLEMDYTGVDPYQEQLDKFRSAVFNGPKIRLIAGDIETHQPDREYDLVFASHMLYYTRSMQAGVNRIASSGREAIIVHHGKRGINTLHEKFRQHVKPGPHIISTDEDVARCCSQCDLGNRTVRRHGFASTVDVSSCVDPESLQGNNLLSFFLEREYGSIPGDVLEELRTFIRETYAPEYQMIHDVGIFDIS